MNFIKIFLILIICISNSFASLEAEVSIYSNYIWRGTTFSENRPVLQLTMDAEDKSGFYAAGFVSNAEFSDEAMGKNSHVSQEVDLSLGKRWSFHSNEIQFSYNRFMFPGAEIFDSNEINLYINISRYIIEISYMNEYFGYEGAYRYIRLGHEWHYTKSTGATLFLGYNSFDNPKGSIISRGDAQTISGAGNPDYIDIFLSHRKTLHNNMTIELAMNWTNRMEYSVEESTINKAKAKDFAVIVGINYPFNL